MDVQVQCGGRKVDQLIKTRFNYITVHSHN